MLNDGASFFHDLSILLPWTLACCNGYACSHYTVVFDYYHQASFKFHIDGQPEKRDALIIYLHMPNFLQLPNNECI
jgi:hypothetical protein